MFLKVVDGDESIDWLPSKPVDQIHKRDAKNHKQRFRCPKCRMTDPDAQH